jgi:hypothetical protein
MYQKEWPAFLQEYKLFKCNLRGRKKILLYTWKRSGFSEFCTNPLSNLEQNLQSHYTVEERNLLSVVLKGQSLEIEFECSSTHGLSET